MENLKTATKLRLGFMIIMFLVLLLGALSYWHSKIMWEQTTGLYEHPLQVRRALGELKADVLTIHWGMKDLFLTEDEKVFAHTIQLINVYEADAFRQLEIIKTQYLGPKTDVDSIEHSLLIWKSMRSETIRLIYAGQQAEAKGRTMHSGVAGKTVDLILLHIGKISDFSKNRGDQFYIEATNSNNWLNTQLLIILVVLLIISYVISYLIVRSIQKPLKELTRSAEDFSNGNLDARSAYQSRNEFGQLASTFNQLAESIQQEIVQRQQVAEITGIMLGSEDLHAFSNVFLNTLIEKTGAQLGAIFLPNETGDSYTCFESIGLANEAQRSFSAKNREGEFGMALESGKIQRTTKIPHDTVMTYNCVTGVFIPSEIVTIPLVSGKDTPAVISIASLHGFTDNAISLIERLLPLLSARINGLIAFQKIRDFSTQLDQQNKELLVQKQELFMQTEEMRLQNTELEVQKNQLNEASKLKTSFLSNMSHELRTPLNSVIALSGVLGRRLNGTIPQEEYSYLEVIERNGKLLLSLINDILDISRIEAGHEEVQISKFKIAKLISEVCQMINPQARQKDVLLIQKECDEIPLVATDYQKVRQILQNLIGNAVKFTEKGTVTVDVNYTSDMLKIVVADTGIGISEKSLQHIFDEFRQADGSTSRRYGGTGLGLTIARKYATMLGGDITVSSKPDVGSLFKLTLPLNNTETAIVFEDGTRSAVKENELITISDTPAAQTKTVLLVDDSGPAIIQLRDILTGGGFQTLVASNGVEAIAMLDQTLPDAIILDLMMPDIDGFDVLKTVRENPRTVHLPVLVLTAKHITKEELSSLKQNNIHQLIQKGDVNRVELLQSVSAMVTKKKPDPVQPVIHLHDAEAKPQILIVEDNPDNMLTMRALLTDKYRIIEATTGKAGVEMALLHHPSLILMDIALPEMNGIEALRAIRSQASTGHIPVVAVTASAMSGDRDAIVAEGFNGYISKPIDIAILEKTIIDWLGK